jgi:hypothetical protein
MRTQWITAAVAATALLGGCSEKTQTIGADVRQDAAAYQGTGMPFTAPGWKPGDKASWEAQIKTRAQNQNDYTKVN